MVISNKDGGLRPRGVKKPRPAKAAPVPKTVSKPLPKKTKTP